MERFITLLKKTVVVILSVYVVLLILIYIFQSKLVYFPSTDVSVNPKTIALEYESIIFEADDKTKLHAWYIPKEGAKTTLFFSTWKWGKYISPS